MAIKNTIPNVSAVVFKKNIISNVLKEKISEIIQYKHVGDWITYIYILSLGNIAYSNKELNKHRRHEKSVTISAFDICQLEEILIVQRKVKHLYNVDKNIITKANNYSQVLYEQFQLATNDAPKITDRRRLNKYYTR